MNLLSEPLWRHDVDPEPPEPVWHFSDAAGHDDYALSEAEYNDLWALYVADGTPFWVKAEPYCFPY